MGSTNVDQYELNDRVLCFYRGLYYEAKIVKITDIGYKIHYQGWSKKYDEMVKREEVPEKLKKFSEEAHIAAQKEVQEATKVAATNSKKKKEEKFKGEPATPSVLSAKKRAQPVAHVQFDMTSAAQAHRDKRICELPVELKQALANDCFVIKEKNLYALPSKYPVEAIVKEYCAHVQVTLDSASEVGTAMKFITSSQGVVDYFDALLSLQLLYKFERLQYVNHFEIPGSPTVKPSAVYGLPHLLRLLSTFDEHVKHWNPRMIKTVAETLTDFVKFLSQKKDEYFDVQRDANPASSAYKKKRIDTAELYDKMGQFEVIEANLVCIMLRIKTKKFRPVSKTRQ